MFKIYFSYYKNQTNSFFRKYMYIGLWTIHMNSYFLEQKALQKNKCNTKVELYNYGVWILRSFFAYLFIKHEGYILLEST